MAVTKLLLAKQELTYGTDPTPDDTNPVETQSLEMERYAGDKVEREVDRQVLGGTESINVVPHTSTSFSVPFAASGTAGTAPQWGILMQACGMDETIVAVTSAAYQMAETGAELSVADSVTLWDYRSQAGKVQKTSGVRGKCMITMGEGELPRIEFSDMLGDYNTPAAGVEPTISDWTGWLTELPFTKDNLPVLTLDGESACTSAFSIDFGQEVARRNLPGCESTIISTYATTGTMSIVAPDIATKNWFTEMESHNGVTLVPLALTYGTVAGETITIAASEVQVSNITESESSQGDLQYDFELSFIDRPIVTCV